MPRVDSSLWVKICGLGIPEQAVAIAQQGAQAIGMIGAPTSSRYVTPLQMRAMGKALLAAGCGVVERVGVFVDADIETLQVAYSTGCLTTLQLHGQESPQQCQAIRQAIPTAKLIKALRIRTQSDWQTVNLYESVVDAVLLDAYHPHLQGGTGETLDWRSLQQFEPDVPWILAGGLNAKNVTTALQLLAPQGIDLSSGVELSPGNKCLSKTHQLFTAINSFSDPDHPP
ncbi:MAG: phosphoribosylanthranilate isomerase [Leptolyngbyaceae cyanobacterium]